ncbi:MAG: hypothetical protein EBY40_13910, partial [Marivivens sp.]|nr:hypothetical protein [Marivivens sp.]
AARPYVAAAILSADTLANGYISVLENVHSKAVLRKFSGAAIQANDDCAFSTPSAGQLTLGEAVLDASALKVNEQVCNADLRATWESAQMRGESSAAPADFSSYVAQYVAAKVAEGIERNIWQGNYASDDGGTDGTYTSFDGICAKIVAGTPGEEDLLTGATTAANILDRIGDLAVPNVIAGDPDTKLFMSRAMKQLYYNALADTYNLPFHAEGAANQYNGYEIITPAGMPDDTFLFAKGENLYFGTNLLTDHIQASVLDLTGVTGDDVTRVIMQFSGGTQVVDLDSIAIARRSS